EPEQRVADKGHVADDRDDAQRNHRLHKERRKNERGRDPSGDHDPHVRPPRREQYRHTDKGVPRVDRAPRPPSKAASALAPARGSVSRRPARTTTRTPALGNSPGFFVILLCRPVCAGPALQCPPERRYVNYGVNRVGLRPAADAEAAQSGSIKGVLPAAKA